MKRLLLILAILPALVGCSSSEGVKTAFSRSEQLSAARDLIDRVTSGRASEFKLRITPGEDFWSYSESDGKILLEGNNGIGIASALNAYLGDYCAWEYSWCGESPSLPNLLPLPDSTVRRNSPYRYRYYLNYCTFNYSMSWWDFDRWEKEIDWMALHGINMPLAVTGQNSVWQRVYARLGIPAEELKDFFSGPAYFNWFWMGNLDLWGGPLPQSFMDKHEALQKQILLRERSLGMTPVLPAFTGHVPPALARKYPDVKIRKTSWVNFPEVSILDPDEELFTRIGQLFIEEQTRLWGTNHYYSADTFNENVPPSADSAYLAAISAKVYASMSSVDPEAVWVMQGWMFYHEKHFWGQPQIQALLSSVPDDKMLILDLWSERYPVWKQTNAYWGKPWLWCMLHNFGQNITLSGNVSSIASDPSAALRDPAAGNMSGIGLTPEGIGHTPIVYSLFLENVWRDEAVDVDEFLKVYLRRRYGCCPDAAFQAWKIIFSTAFENTVNNGGHESIITGRPTFAANPRGCTNTLKCYDSADLLRAWDLLCSCIPECRESDGFRYDLVDITRQVLADYASEIQSDFASAFQRGSRTDFHRHSGRFLDLISDMDSLLGTRKEFLLGEWLESAKALGDTPEEKALYERNARNLISVWGNRDCRIFDYACKQWSGMMNGYYKCRWSLFFDEVETLWTSFSKPDFDEKCKDFEWAWTQSAEIYPTEATGDEIACVESLRDKYRASL